MAANGVIPTVTVSRPKTFMVPVIFEKEEEPPAKLARGTKRSCSSPHTHTRVASHS